MFLASQTGSAWTGPLGNLPRPRGWKPTNEAAWIDYVRSAILTDTVWESIWTQIPMAMWEEWVYDWRNQIESVVVYYVECQPELILELAEDKTSENE